MRPHSQKGFTLVEVMISLLIFALIASASVFALRLGVNARDQLDEADGELKALQIARILIKEDLLQVVPRQVRDEFGDLLPAAFVGGQLSVGGRLEDDEDSLIAFVRGGWVNPGAIEPRSALQHVEYIYRDNTLIRRSRLYLDETENSEVLERVLFKDLVSADVEFLTGEFQGELQWANAWPVSGTAGPPPKAVAIILRLDGDSELRQLFWIGV